MPMESVVTLILDTPIYGNAELILRIFPNLYEVVIKKEVRAVVWLKMTESPVQPSKIRKLISIYGDM